MRLDFKSRLYFVFVLITIICFIYVLFYNNYSKSRRIQELKYYIQSSELNDRKTDHLYLVSLYKNRFNIYSGKINQSEYDYNEFKILSLLDDFTGKSLEGKPQGINRLIYRFFDVDSITVIDPGDETTKLIEAAFFMERNYNYKKALDFYKKAISKSETKTYSKYSVLLHYAFSKSMLGFTDEAQLNYEEILVSNADSSIKYAAALLLKYMSVFENYRYLEKKSDDSSEKLKKMFYLQLYQEALLMADNLLKTGNNKDLSKVLYYKARILEETFEKKKAIAVYRQIMLKYPQSKYASASNRRVMIMGVSLKNTTLVEFSKNNNRVFKDELFDKMIYVHTIQNNQSNKKELNGESKNIETVLDKETLSDLEFQEKDLKIDIKIKPQIENSKSVEVVYIIKTRKGSIIRGTLIKEEADYYKMKTIMGSVIVEKTKILSMEKE